MLRIPQNRPLDILAIGEPLYEFAQEPDGRFRAGFGGDTSNVAIAAARVGAKTAYATLLGADMFGDAFMDLWAREGVDTVLVRRHPTAPTGVYVVTQGAQGHVFTYLRQGSAASRLTPEHAAGWELGRTRILHVSGISLAISETAQATALDAVLAAGETETLVSFDTNFRRRLWNRKARPVINSVAKLSDILKTSIEDARVLTGRNEPRAIAEFYRQLGASVVVVTLGAEGVFVAWEGESLALAPHKVESVDATGAGDAFTGAFLAELCRGAEVPRAARFANAAAALSTRAYGAVAGLPRRDEVEAFLAA
jgi:2-dehydro-3-deoxygluconokinase